MSCSLNLQEECNEYIYIYLFKAPRRFITNRKVNSSIFRIFDEMDERLGGSKTRLMQIFLVYFCLRSLLQVIIFFKLHWKIMKDYFQLNSTSVFSSVYNIQRQKYKVKTITVQFCLKDPVQQNITSYNTHNLPHAKNYLGNLSLNKPRLGYPPRLVFLLLVTAYDCYNFLKLFDYLTWHF